VLVGALIRFGNPLIVHTEKISPKSNQHLFIFTGFISRGGKDLSLLSITQIRD